MEKTSLVYRFPRLYDFWMRKTPEFHSREQLQEASKVIGKNKTVLDLACGTSLVTSFLDPTVKYHGFDLNRKFVSYDQRRGLDVKLANIFDEKNYPAHVDFVLISHALHHVHPREKELIALAQKHAGTVLIVEGTIDSKVTMKWVRLTGKSNFIFRTLGDADGINTWQEIVEGTLGNDQMTLENLTSEFGGKSRLIPGGMLLTIPGTN